MTDQLDDLLRGIGANATQVPAESRARIRERLLLRRDDVMRARDHRSSWAPRRPVVALVSAAAVAAVAGGIVGPRLLDEPDRHPHAAEEGQPAPDSSDTLVPEDTARDVVTWADQVVVVTPTSETEVWGDTTLTDDGSGDGLVMRNLTIRVDDTVWTRTSGVHTGAQFTALDWGWVVKEGKKAPFDGPAAPRFVVGQQYVMTVAKDGAEWVIFGAASFPVRAGEVAPAEGQDTPLARLSKGKSPTDLGRLLGQTSPDPEVLPFLTLPFRERVQAHTAAR